MTQYDLDIMLILDLILRYRMGIALWLSSLVGILNLIRSVDRCCCRNDRG